MKSANAISAPTQYFNAKAKTQSDEVLTKRCENPWKSQDLLELGWSEFMKKKSEETLKSLNEVKIEDFRKQRTLARTSSAPVNIPQPKQRSAKNRAKKQLTRVKSAGIHSKSPVSPRSPRIAYDRDFLLNCRQSPLSLTPPTDLPEIPGATVPFRRRNKKALEKTNSNLSVASTSSIGSVDSVQATREEKQNE